MNRENSCCSEPAITNGAVVRVTSNLNSKFAHGDNSIVRGTEHTKLTGVVGRGRRTEHDVAKSAGTVNQDQDQSFVTEHGVSEIAGVTSRGSGTEHGVTDEGWRDSMPAVACACVTEHGKVGRGSIYNGKSHGLDTECVANSHGLATGLGDSSVHHGKSHGLDAGCVGNSHGLDTGHVGNSHGLEAGLGDKTSGFGSRRGNMDTGRTSKRKDDDHWDCNPIRTTPSHRCRQGLEHGESKHFCNYDLN